MHQVLTNAPGRFSPPEDTLLAIDRSGVEKNLMSSNYTLLVKGDYTVFLYRSRKHEYYLYLVGKGGLSAHYMPICIEEAIYYYQRFEESKLPPEEAFSINGEV